MLKILKDIPLIRKFIYSTSKVRAAEIVSRIEPYLSEGDRVLDLGCGMCNISELVQQKGYEVVSADIKSVSYVDGIEPVVYDGNRLPFKDNAFDVCLLITVLHHTPDPDKVIKEAIRTSKRIIIIEDIYINLFHKYVTYIFDSILNFEYFNHPHSNKSDKQWKKLFSSLNLELIATNYKWTLLLIKHGLYFLSKK